MADHHRACLRAPSMNNTRGQICGGTKAVPSVDELAACQDWCVNWVSGGVDVGSGRGIRADVGMRTGGGAGRVIPLAEFRAPWGHSRSSRDLSTS